MVTSKGAEELELEALTEDAAVAEALASGIEGLTDEAFTKEQWFRRHGSP